MKRLVNLFILVVFCFSHLSGYAASMNLPQPGTLLSVSEQFAPVTLKGLKFDRQNPFKLSFILDEGSTKLTDAQLKETSKTLIRYFLAALTTPGQDMWVNLSPYEQDRVLPDSFAATDLGNDMLAQDYLLKQLASSLTYPETELGKKYWDVVNGTGGSRTAPTNSFNKVWITPNETQVYETGDKVFITKSSVKILSDEDYLARGNAEGGALRALAMQKNSVGANNHSPADQAFKTLIVPAIEKEVNTGKNFANFRQLHSAVILAAWFKNRLKDSIYQQLYIDKNKTAGIDANDPQAKEKIFNQYVEAFKKGAYNYVKKEAVGANDYSPAKKINKRAYFSGGAVETPITEPGNWRATTLPSQTVPAGTAEAVTADSQTAQKALGDGTTEVPVTIKISSIGSRLVSRTENNKMHEALKLKPVLDAIAETIKIKLNGNEADFRQFLIRQGTPGKWPGIKFSYTGIIDLGANQGQDGFLATRLGLSEREIPAAMKWFTLELTDDGILTIQSPLFGGGHAGLNRLAVYGRNPTEIQHELYELRKLIKFARALSAQELVHYAPGVPLGDCLRNFLKDLVGKKQLDGDLIRKLDNAISAADVNIIGIKKDMEKKFSNAGGVSHGEESTGQAQLYKIDLFLQALHADAQKFFPVKDEPADDAQTIFLASGPGTAATANTRKKPLPDLITDVRTALSQEAIFESDAVAQVEAALLKGASFSSLVKKIYRLIQSNQVDLEKDSFVAVAIVNALVTAARHENLDLTLPAELSRLQRIARTDKGVDEVTGSISVSDVLDVLKPADIRGQTAFYEFCKTIAAVAKGKRAASAKVFQKAAIAAVKKAGAALQGKAASAAPSVPGGDSQKKAKVFADQVIFDAWIGWQGKRIDQRTAAQQVVIALSQDTGEYFFANFAKAIEIFQLDGRGKKSKDAFAAACAAISVYLDKAEHLEDGLSRKDDRAYRQALRAAMRLVTLAQEKTLPDLITDVRTALSQGFAFNGDAVAHVKEALLQADTFDALTGEIYQLLISGKVDIKKDDFVAQAIVEALAAKGVEDDFVLPQELRRLVDAARSAPSVDEVSPAIDSRAVIKALKPQAIKDQKAFAGFCRTIAAMAHENKDSASALSLKREAVEAVQQAAVALGQKVTTRSGTRRDARTGKFRNHPGKSPQDAARLIVKAGLTSFTLGDFLTAYVDHGQGLNYEALAENPETTAREDLNGLVEKGILRVVFNTRENVYTVVDQDALQSYGGINEKELENSLTIKVEGNGVLVPMWKNIPLKPEDVPGFDFTIDGLKRNQTAAQVVF